MRGGIVKKLFGKTKLYAWLRERWCEHMVEVPRRHLRRHGRVAMKIVHDALEGSSAAYFADFGTLLGIERDHGFVRHDDDIDYSVVAGSISPLALYERLCSRLVFLRAFEYKGRITELTFLYKRIQIDFFFNFSCGSSMLAMIYFPGPEAVGCEFGSRWRARGVWRTVVTGCRPIRFKRVSVPVPNNTRELLRETYGSWERSIEGWKGTDDYGQRPRVELEGLSIIVSSDRVREIGMSVENTIDVSYEPR